jgi:diguanylate cyclase (GGDEF)-like protein
MPLTRLQARSCLLSPVEQIMTTSASARLAVLPSGDPVSFGEEQLAKPRLLIVDDIADNRTILARRFERRGFEISEADRGQRALDLIAQENFDLVLLDVMMPEMDGFEVLKRIREHHSSVALPVIMVTAKSQSEDVVQALELGANDYVTKPVDFAVALARVNAQVGRKRAEEGVRQANEALRQANDDLERRVAERTAKLVSANEQLQLEIEHRQKSEAKVEYLAHHDPLTGLANRVLLGEQLDQALAHMRRTRDSLAVLFLDLDGFKSVNDTLGHTIGDALLKAVAERLRESVRDTDKVARLGGDEFAILQVSEQQPNNAASLAQRLIDVLSTPFSIDGHQVVVGASIGVAVALEKAADAEQLLKSADLAMYRAKADGRGRFCFFEPEMDANAQARRLLELELRNALVEGGFELHYQPLVNLKTNSVTGFEALMRWSTPERGRISPGEFIPIAEETGLIVPLGEWALRQACAEAATWPGDIRIAVNLSPSQFKSGNLVPAVVNALSQSSLPAHRLELEITESVLLEKTDGNLAVLNQLRELGVRISMDDFGTGYSSLSYLRSFRFDKIKIDQSFIRDLSDQDDSRAIVRAIAALGSSFGMTTTAEGVETEQQLRCLRLEGCTEIQGYLVSPPRPASEIPDLLARLASGAFARAA